MDKNAAIKDIAANFVSDFRNGILLTIPPDGRLYRACLSEYGYASLADDEKVKSEVSSVVNETIEHHKRKSYLQSLPKKAIVDREYKDFSDAIYAIGEIKQALVFMAPTFDPEKAKRIIQSDPRLSGFDISATLLFEKAVGAIDEGNYEGALDLVVSAKEQLINTTNTLEGKYSTMVLKQIESVLKKNGSLDAFQIDVILSILKNQIAPIVVGSGNIPVLFAYGAIKKLLENLKEQQLKAMEAPSPMESDEQYGFPMLQQPTYSAKKEKPYDPGLGECPLCGKLLLDKRTASDGSEEKLCQECGWVKAGCRFWLKKGEHLIGFEPHENGYRVWDGGKEAIDLDKVESSIFLRDWIDDGYRAWHKPAALSNDQLEEVSEGLAERAHERWMEREKNKGNADNPNMVPYEKLPEEDKESDRDYAYEFQDLLDEMGFEIAPKG